MNCPRCDRPVATEADFDRAEQPGDDALCWDATTCPRKDWHAEALRLRAIVEGSAAAPTDATVIAHCVAGGMWSALFVDIALPAVLTTSSQATARAWRKVDVPPTRWWALDAYGRPCAWPSPR